MTLNWRRFLLLGPGLILTLGLAAAQPPAAISSVSTLTWETLSGASSQGNSRACLSPTFSVSGTATGPYAGSFTESGTWDPLSFTFSATFTITAGTTTITGTKTFSRDTPGLSGTFDCGADPTTMHLTGVPYSATIDSPNGRLHDEGVSTLDIAITASGAATLSESFTSSLAQPVPLLPTSKDQCKNGGWKSFPRFKNQGRCVSSVVSP